MLGLERIRFVLIIMFWILEKVMMLWILTVGQTGTLTL